MKKGLTQIAIPVLMWLMLLCSPCFAVSTYMGIQPGLSTRANVEAVFGRPVNNLGPTLFEYSIPGGKGKLVVDFREKDFVVDRLERHFIKPVSRSAMIRALELPEQSEEKRTNKEGKLVEYFGDIKTLAFTYASGEEKSGIISVGYYSMELYEKSLDLAKNPTVQFDPTGCRDIYFWAQSERETAKRSKNVGRHQEILEISIISQRGECDKARNLAAGYKQRYQ